MASNIGPVTTGLSGTVLLRPAVIVVGGGSTVYTATDGGVTITVPRNYENVQFDGKYAPIEQLDRPVVTDPAVIETNAIEWSRAKFPALEPDGTLSTVSANLFKLVPKNSGDFLTSGAYTEVIAAGRRGDGTLLGIRFPKALVIVGSVPETGNTQLGIALRIESRVPADATDLGTPSYHWIDGNSLTALDIVT